jgi:hypothetical protein
LIQALTTVNQHPSFFANENETVGTH